MRGLGPTRAGRSLIGGAFLLATVFTLGALPPWVTIAEAQWGQNPAVDLDSGGTTSAAVGTIESRSDLTTDRTSTSTLTNAGPVGEGSWVTPMNEMIDPAVRANQAGGEPATVTIGSGTVLPGEQLTVPLEALAVPDGGLAAATVDILYDPSVVGVVRCDDDPNDVFDVSPCNPHFAFNTVRLAVISMGGVSGDLLLANITFRAVGSPGQVSPLDVVVVTFADTEGADIPFSDRDGSIAIRTPAPAPTGAPTPTAAPTPTPRPAPSPTATPAPSCGKSVPIVIGSGAVSPGEQLTVPLQALGVAGCRPAAATVDVVYDPSVVDVVNCDDDPSGVLDLSPCNPDFAFNTLRLAVISIGGVSGDVLLANITFQAVGSPGRASPLDVVVVTLADTTGGDIPFSDGDGTIAIRNRSSSSTATPPPASAEMSIQTAPPTPTPRFAPVPAPTATSTAVPKPTLTPDPTSTATPAAAALSAVERPHTGVQEDTSRGTRDGGWSVIFGPAAVGAGLVALAAGGWHSRKRWLR